MILVPRWLYVVSMVWTLLVSLLLLTGRVCAHEWYPQECCSGTDCEPMETILLERNDEGWILPGGKVIPYEAARRSPDDHFHWCRSIYEGGSRGPVIRPDGKPYCLFVPEGMG